MTASSPRDRLSALQRDFLAAFAARPSGFFLTGEGVLVGGVLCHRRTDDLDFFTTQDDAMGEADRLVRGVAAEIGAALEPTQTSPDFRRYALRRGPESVIVDFIRERVPHLYPKVVRDGVAMDAVEEIVANKICALLGRVEIRDDLYRLQKAGFRVERFLPDAQRKDAGVAPGTLAWVLSQIVVPDALPDVDSQALREFVRDLEASMRRLSLPGDA